MIDIYMDYVKEYHEIPSFEQFKQFAGKKNISVVYKEAKEIFLIRPNLPASLERLVEEKEKQHKRHATDAALSAQVYEHEFAKIHSSKALHTPPASSGIMQDEKEKEQAPSKKNTNVCMLYDRETVPTPNKIKLLSKKIVHHTNQCVSGDGVVEIRFMYFWLLCLF